MLITVCCYVVFVRGALSVVRCLLFAGCRLLLVVQCLVIVNCLNGVRGLSCFVLFVVCYWLLVVRCSLFVVGWLVGCVLCVV